MSIFNLNNLLSDLFVYYMYFPSFKLYTKGMKQLHFKKKNK